ncbi:unnamed protein product [Clonostachys rhizophaga]|uniref:Uncharacterized protein n=1 Tax=Clonostachys rhizophaga TaxID=160324 RepID=A0A9N9V2H9_9HYPO|nr:unnamed protein product [Clonostachys rhizophaga]
MLAAVMALKAYSSSAYQHSPHEIGSEAPRSGRLEVGNQPTDLVQAAIVGKDGNVTVVCAGCGFDTVSKDLAVGWPSKLGEGIL